MKRPVNEAPQRPSWLTKLIQWQCTRATETGNMLHYFAALEYAIEGAYGEFDTAKDRDTDSLEAANPDATASDLNVLLPKELCEFLFSVSSALRQLGQGFDFRYRPTNTDASVTEWREAERAYQLRHGITHERAAELVTQALGLTRPGFNAFRNYRREQVAGWAMMQEEALREAGVSPSEAREKVATQLGIDDERSYRRLLAGKQRQASKSSRKS